MVRIANTRSVVGKGDLINDTECKTSTEGN